jgi:hypothetical protein
MHFWCLSLLFRSVCRDLLVRFAVLLCLFLTFLRPPNLISVRVLMLAYGVWEAASLRIQTETLPLFAVVLIVRFWDVILCIVNVGVRGVAL